MTSSFGRDLIDSLGEALDHAQGNSTAAREHRFEVPNVRAIREGLDMSEQEFSRVYHIPLPTF